jgi:hypothetical protein
MVPPWSQQDPNGEHDSLSRRDDMQNGQSTPDELVIGHSFVICHFTCHLRQVDGTVVLPAAASQ